MRLWPASGELRANCGFSERNLPAAAPGPVTSQRLVVPECNGKIVHILRAYPSCLDRLVVENDVSFYCAFQVKVDAMHRALRRRQAVLIEEETQGFRAQACFLLQFTGGSLENGVPIIYLAAR